VERFRSAREAKEYLVSRILAQAKQIGIALSDAERKMLYFSESGWTLPDMKEVSAQFDRDYDQNEYEKKIADVIRRLSASQDDSAKADWDDAVGLLRREDHYLLVMIDAAAQPPAGGGARLLIPTLAVTIVFLVGAELLAGWLNLNDPSLRFGIAAILTVLMVAFLFWRTLRRQ
jgi:hypothetical protein